MPSQFRWPVINLSLLERRARIITGLILALFIIIHLSNHVVGLVSYELMESMRAKVSPLWRNDVGATLLYGSLLIHFLLALLSLYRRQSLVMPPWEMAQLVLGLAIIPLLVTHATSVWVYRNLTDVNVDYAFVLDGIFHSDWRSLRQFLLVMVSWLHVCVGLHYFLRLFASYRQWVTYLYPLAWLMPALVIMAMAKFNFELETIQQQHGQVTGRVYPIISEDDLSYLLLIIFYALIAVTLLMRQVRIRNAASGEGLLVKHASGQQLSGRKGQSLLEILRHNRIDHASVCGGRGRCTTCRIRVDGGLEQLPVPSALETNALNRINAPFNVRLACQTRPEQDVQITPLLPADYHPGQGEHIGGISGEERQLVCLFVDLRDSTGMAEYLMPYDVLFMLNQFFVEMSQAIDDSHGYYAQFGGDGLMALFGLERGLSQGCLDALYCAQGMQQRIDLLNQRLQSELKNPLRISIGIHCGDAIVGKMGPLSTPIYSAIGDTINIAARLEDQSKKLECILVASEAVVENAGLEDHHGEVKEVTLRGKQQPLRIYTWQSRAELSALPVSPRR